MAEQYHSQTWAEKEALKDKVKISERGGEVIGVIAIGLIALFFLCASNTGYWLILGSCRTKNL